MGDEATWSPGLTLCTHRPGAGVTRLIHDGDLLLTTALPDLRFGPQSPGAYRIEAWRRSRGRWRGWIYSNPIYLR